MFFLTDIVGGKEVTIDDIKVLCSHAPAEYSLNIGRIVPYCAYFGWISLGETITLSDKIKSLLHDHEILNHELVRCTVDVLFQEEELRLEMFVFDAVVCRYRFRSELFPLGLAGIRNTLISQGFFEVDRSHDPVVFFIGDQYVSLISTHCRSQKTRLTLEKLKKKLELDAAIGEKAEMYVLDFERRRLGEPKAQLVRIISDIDVTAGYDVVSFHSVSSDNYDRFIEVKAVSRGTSFFWSENEYEIAKLKGKDYYLYLVDLSSIDDPSYVPIMISDPTNSIMASPDWLVEPQSYRIRKI